jgi:hypothetical protein
MKASVAAGDKATEKAAASNQNIPVFIDGEQTLLSLRDRFVPFKQWQE